MNRRRTLLAVILSMLMVIQSGTVVLAEEMTGENATTISNELEGAPESGQKISYELVVEQELKDASVVANEDGSGISLFSNTAYSNCFGDQLDGLAKEIYDAYISVYATDKATGDYEYKLKSPITFKAEVNNGAIVENQELKEKEAMIQAAVQTAMDAYLYDHPEIFWMRGGSCSYNINASGTSTADLTGTISTIVLKPMEIYSGASNKISDYDANVQRVVAAIQNNVGSSVNRYNVLKSIHDYICENAYYKTSNDMNVHSTEPFFIGDGGLVCEGYAKTFKVLCDKFNIPCVCVGGTADTASEDNGSHMWNYVQMEDSAWYLVDTTWDDQGSKLYDTYFLAGWTSKGFYKTIAEERVEKTDFSSSGYMNFTYPELSQKFYSNTGSGGDGDDKSDEPTVSTKSIKNAEIVIPESYYTGKAITPKVIIKDGVEVLKANIDYTIACSNNINAGTVTIIITGKGAYSGTITKTFVIKKANQTISGLKTFTKTYGDKAFSLGAKSNGNGKLSYKSGNTKVATVDSTGKVTVKGAGKVTITVTAAATTNYNQATKKVSITVGKANQTISGAKSFTRTDGNKAFSLQAKAKGKLSCKSSNKTVVTVNSNGKVTINGPGKATITITAAATSNYSKATKKVAIQVNPKKVTSVKVKSAKKMMTVSWKKDSKVTGYQITCAENKNFTKGRKNVTVSKKNTVKKTIKKLKSKKTYYVKVRAYKKVGSQKIYGAYSSVKIVKVK